jgi:hypothetical protein
MTAMPTTSHPELASLLLLPSCIVPKRTRGEEEMKAYVAKDRNGSVTKGWLLRQGYSIDSPVCRMSITGTQDKLEEVPVEQAVRSAGIEGSVVGGAGLRTGAVETGDF